MTGPHSNIVHVIGAGLAGSEAAWQALTGECLRHLPPGEARLMLAPRLPADKALGSAASPPNALQ